MEKNEQIICSSLEDIMGDRFGRYSKYIIQDRALPDARDGLKPVQRRILYAMYEDSNRYDKGYRKSAKTVGNVIGNYHPHGDTSVYDAMVRMSQEWKVRLPQIDMQGNNGSIDDDPAAAMRYTEARLSHISEYLLMDIEKETVSWAPNFDDTTMEPTVLPARYPNLLVNGISGIAAGYATNIPPHNLIEVLNATLHRIKNPDSTLSDLMKFIKGPDFPTGGIIQGKQGIIDAFTTGKGKIVVRAKVGIEQDKNIQKIIITEIPYEVIKSNLVKKFDEIRLLKKIDGILDVRDESDRNGLKIVIDIKKEMDAESILQYLYKHSDLQISYNYNIVAIVNKQPKQLGLIQMLDTFIQHRVDVITKRSQYELKKKQNRCHILQGLIKAISILDEIITLIKNSIDKNDAKINLRNAFQFTDMQAEAIVNMRLYRLSNTDIRLLQEEFQQLETDIDYLTSLLNDSTILYNEMCNELENVKKVFPTKRLSTLEDNIQELIIDKTKMIAEEKVIITVSRDGYLKKVSKRSYAASINDPTGLKENDILIGVQETSTLHKVLFFTKQGNYGYLPVFELDDAKWKDIGNHINNKLKMSAQESIVSAFTFSSFNRSAYIISITKNGFIKKTPLFEYEVLRNNKTMINMRMNADDEIIDICIAYEGDEILLLSKNGYMSRYPISYIPLTSNKSKGVKAMHLIEDSIIKGEIFQHDQKQLVIFNSENGAKRIKIENIDCTGRPVKGGMICKKRKSKAYEMIYMKLCDLEDQIITKDSTIILKNIPLMNRESTFSSLETPFIKDSLILEIPHIINKKEKIIETNKKEINLSLELNDTI